MEDTIARADAQDFLDAAGSRLHATTNELLHTQAALAKEKRLSTEKDKRIAELEAELASLGVSEAPVATQ